MRAQIRRIDSYSAHGDRDDILAWLKARAPIEGSIFLTHGEAGAIETLRRDLQAQDVGASIVTPEIGESYSLEAGLPAKRTATGRVELRDVVARDWQNDYAQFLTNLKQELQEVETGARRREAIARMRSVLDEYAAHRKKHRKTG